MNHEANDDSERTYKPVTLYEESMDIFSFIVRYLQGTEPEKNRRKKSKFCPNQGLSSKIAFSERSSLLPRKLTFFFFLRKLTYCVPLPPTFISQQRQEQTDIFNSASKASKDTETARQQRRHCVASVGLRQFPNKETARQRRQRRTRTSTRTKQRKRNFPVIKKASTSP